MNQLHPGHVPSSTPSGAPPLWQVLLAAGGAVAAMIAALYFAGRDLTPVAMVGTALFVGLGGLSFELARRRAAAATPPRR
jgi:hypothetical protein